MLIAVLVVDEEEVAQRTMDHIEADVRAELMRVGGVLQQRVDEHLRAEVVVDAGGRQRRQVRPARQGDVVQLHRDRGVELLVWTESRAERVAMFVATVELAD